MSAHTSKQTWSTPQRRELSARHTRGGSDPDVTEVILGFNGSIASCYPGGPTGTTGPVGS